MSENGKTQPWPEIIGPELLAKMLTEHGAKACISSWAALHELTQRQVAARIGVSQHHLSRSLKDEHIGPDSRRALFELTGVWLGGSDQASQGQVGVK